jgi:orotate phosphoribosyltransferase
MQKVREFIEDNCIARVPYGEKVLLRRGATPGSEKLSDYYTWIVMTRAAMFDPAIMQEINNHFFSVFEEKLRDGYILVGIEHSSSPLVASFVYEGERRGITIPAFSIRKGQKIYGLKNWTEGIVPEGNKFILLDDVSSDYRSALKHMISKLPEIINCGPYKAEFYCLINLSKHDIFGNIPIHSMFTVDDFILDYEKYKNAKLSQELNDPDNSGTQSMSLESVPA